MPAVSTPNSMPDFAVLARQHHPIMTFVSIFKDENSNLWASDQRKLPQIINNKRPRTHESSAARGTTSSSLATTESGNGMASLEEQALAAPRCGQLSYPGPVFLKASSLLTFSYLCQCQSTKIIQPESQPTLHCNKFDEVTIRELACLFILQPRQCKWSPDALFWKCKEGTLWPCILWPHGCCQGCLLRLSRARRP